MLLFRTIRWRLIGSSLLAIGIPLMVFAYVLSSLLWRFYLQQLEQELRSKAFIIADSSGPILSPTTPDDPRALAGIVDRWRRYSPMRVTVANSDGLVRAATVREIVGLSITDEQQPGMREATLGRRNSTIWKSPNFGYQDTMYVNQPVLEDGQVVGAVRVAYSLAQIQANVHRMRSTLFASFGTYAALIVVLTLWLAGTLARPIEALNRSAQEFARGNLEHRVDVQGTIETTHLAGTLNRMTARLQHLEGLRRHYVSNVSHELRTPLASIRGMAETLMEHGETDPTLRERYLPRIIAQTDRLARLATQLLDLAQIESENLISSFEQVSLRSVIEEAVQTCTPAAVEKGITVEMDAPSWLPQLNGDRYRLVQVFVNLIDNGVRHSAPGGKVTVRVGSADGRLTAAVEDTGEGVAPEHLPHLFDRFYRVERARSRRSGGTGLGLSIVRQIIQAHQGTIRVESAIDEGTRLTIDLPVSPATNAVQALEGEKCPN